MNPLPLGIIVVTLVIRRAKGRSSRQFRAEQLPAKAPVGGSDINERIPLGPAV